MKSARLILSIAILLLGIISGQAEGRRKPPQLIPMITAAALVLCGAEMILSIL